MQGPKKHLEATVHHVQEGSQESCSLPKGTEYKSKPNASGNRAPYRKSGSQRPQSPLGNLESSSHYSPKGKQTEPNILLKPATEAAALIGILGLWGSLVCPL
jgi:hypothetical protein